MRFTVAIDGPAAAGKGTISRAVADRFGFAHLDTGALYRAVNRVNPSLIRVEADEVTYNFHVMLRFELELALLDAADAYIARNGLDLPEEPEARRMLPDPQCVTQPLVELDLAQAGVTSIIWATGYAVDFSWLQVDAFDAKGKPQHQRGVSSEPGVYFLGLPWLSRRGSSFIWGVWHDAKHVAGHIATQRTYLAYRDSAARQHAD